MSSMLSIQATQPIGSLSPGDILLFGKDSTDKNSDDNKDIDGDMKVITLQARAGHDGSDYDWQ